MEPVTVSQTNKKNKRPRKRSTVIPIASFSRLVHELSQQQNKNNYNWNAEAIRILQEQTEAHLENKFHVCGKLSELCNKHTVTPEIFQFSEDIKKAIET
jgi:histone H3/H4